jgi:succinate dehydrogenase/fumarate reductase flavoprotein subunit
VKVWLHSTADASPLVSTSAFALSVANSAGTPASRRGIGILSQSTPSCIARSTRVLSRRGSARLPRRTFKQLADLDITQDPMEIDPTTHYVMGGVRVDGDTQMSNVPGLFAAGECAAGINGANRLGGNSLSDILVFGKRAGEFAAKFAKGQKSGTIDALHVERS